MRSRARRVARSNDEATLDPPPHTRRCIPGGCPRIGRQRALSRSRAATSQLDATAHHIIYVATPTFGARGLYLTIVHALGAKPRAHKADLFAQTQRLLAAEEHERRRRVVVIIDEAHLLAPDQLEELRLLTNAEMDSQSPFANPSQHWSVAAALRVDRAPAKIGRAHV